MSADRERRLLFTIVTLLGDATSSSDVEARMQSIVDESVALLDADAASLMLLDASGKLKVAALLGRDDALPELLQLAADEGPCLEAVRTGDVVSESDLSAHQSRWPGFSRAAVDAGYRSVHSIPLRLRSAVIGSLTLFRHDIGPVDADDRAAARALADVATIALTQQRRLDDAAETRAQLQSALNSRAVIEQAKGWIAYRYAVDAEKAFTLLREHARTTSTRLSDVARGVLTGHIAIGVLVEDHTVRA
jgi:GAF domain-containing protein